jgi:myosin-1
VRRAGFAFKKPYALFLTKYKCVCPATWPQWHGEPRDAVSTLLQHLNYSEGVEYALGVSKVFIRSSKTFFELEECLDKRKEELASLIKAYYKGYRQRIEYKRMVKAGKFYI